MEFLRQRRVRLPGARPMRMVTPPIGPDVRVRYSGSYSIVRGQADALRQVLRFRLAERRHTTRGQYSGLLDEQALYRLAGGDEAIFMRRAVESAPDQDLCILLDESASMGPGHRHARATAVLFHHALRGLPGVRHWVFGFSGYGRAIALYRYISPAHTSLQQPERLGAVRSREATPLAEAVAGAAEAMLAEGHGRERLMIVVTDGQPDDPEGARLALRSAESRGVVILGLGIAADASAARDLFNHFTMYEDVASLPRKVGAILRRVVGNTS
jgi:nitric oxide reductase activation protein